MADGMLERLVRAQRLIGKCIDDLEEPPIRPPVRPPVEPPTRPPVDPPTRPPVQVKFEAHAYASGRVEVEGTVVATQQANPIAWCVREYQTKGPLRIYVHGRHPHIWFAGGYSAQASDAATSEVPLDVEIVKGSDGAQVRGVTLGGLGSYDRGEMELIQLAGLHVMTQKGSRAAVTQMKALGDLILSQVTFGPDMAHLSAYGGAGMKWGIHALKGCRKLQLLNCPRGKHNGAPVRYEEHWAYLGGVGDTLIEGNDISGGNRTGFQIRSPIHYPRPSGPIIIRRNRCVGYGWDWSTMNGGAAITVWENPDAETLIEGNTVTNAKYGCVRIARQPPDQTEHLTRDGFAHSEVVFRGNTFTNVKGDRSAVGCSDVEELFIEDGTFTGPSSKAGLVIDTSTAAKWGANPCREVVIGERVRASSILHWNGEDYVPYFRS